MTNRPHGTLYTGVTANIARRAWEHRDGVGSAFTRRHRLKLLVYAERHEEILAAITREKNLKDWHRAWKVRLIERDNPNWEDLYDRIHGGP